ncbi:hypothetical protein [Polluticoccus soli]|uniref:hypothetical protein n=1 Tax=Polluticoccus soli TaxID=3034150 RepID=UPI0023E23BD8|nr:hypothetical protein [Flavipsychrobacter sp. JY13-12]
MKLQALILASCATLLFSCKRENTATVVPVDPNPMQYAINGISDKTIRWTDSIVMPLSVVYGSGNQERLTLSAIELPANITAKFEPASGIPTFSTLLTLRSTNLTAGKHTIKIKATTDKDSVKTFALVLTSKGLEACYGERPGEYTDQMYRNNMPYFYTDNTVVAGPGTNQITIQQVQTSLAGPIDIQVIVNCSNYTLTVVEKAIDGLTGYTVRGSGKFTDNTLTVDFALWNGSTQAESYTLNMVKK